MIQYPRLFTETVTLRPTIGPEIPVPGCTVQGLKSLEPDNEGLWRVETQITVYVPHEHAAKFEASAELYVRGSLYRVVGDVLTEQSIFTGDKGMVPVTVEKTTG